MAEKKKVLVTGADGFIGSHLTEMLLAQGYAVRALSQYNSFNNWGWLEGMQHPDLEIVSGDVRDAHFCKHITDGMETVFHLAALIAIPYSYVAPDSYVDTNIKGTLNMCQAAQEMGVKRMLVTSTSEVYGTAQYVPIDEKHPKQAQSPYSATKIGADAMAMSFYNAFELPVVIVRPFNTYGPRQSARAIIPTIITQIAHGATEIKLGDLTPTRDFNFVKDTCRGFMALAECDAAIGKEVNICTNFEISMRDTLELIADIMKVKVNFIEDEQRIRPKNSEVFRLWGDNALIKSLTGFEPMYDIRRGLTETIEWFTNAENLSQYKANIYNV
ncbi:NAD-dependent 4,6-dehydratase LegB [Bacteroides sp.]|uniref:NAD-dependent 4,6-dehydratase LegB n=1 Tax=Bacteroides sp. TaxID=29523 RepID=UPI001B70D56A|nr:NAD-dependent 4,6-dehydratase LegB [Bacteroides sp.]MBP6066281.1 NAD-dependent 4,6-dehydratase LegB [Bacteroides sp.]MBP6068281.1 NAD-dependent 4,6-dehydratase LegB [Bacteroides sp.]MBP6937276.1 NAD-dependent 4,6-dehydratase LegB [Bacteroides sp.]MBP8622850.1 NAD-dependent 4,6-dehydratase LegB [Bacteroides sp.]MBP9506406.1 NAD-dependent 4,6-dehydratase LegB [Bacteroides sp.]